MSNTREKLTISTVASHWLIAIAMIGMVGFGLYIADLPRSPTKGWLIGIHKTIGLAILLLALFRLFMRSKNPFPDHVGNYTPREATLSRIVRIFLVLAMFLLPFSGMMMTFGGGYPLPVFGLFTIGPFEKVELLSELGHIGHELGGKLLIAAILLHVAGALKHHIIDKDDTIKRMTGKKVELRDKA